MLFARATIRDHRKAVERLTLEGLRTISGAEYGDGEEGGGRDTVSALSTIEFVPAARDNAVYGGSRSARSFLDVVVNGVSLWRRLGWRHDMVSALCFEFVLPEVLKSIDRLLLRYPADLPNDRRSLFVCAECGDIGCGAITVSVTRAADVVVWQDFGYENNYEDCIRRDEYRDVGPFEFDLREYRVAFYEAAQKLKAHHRP